MVVARGGGCEGGEWAWFLNGEGVRLGGEVVGERPGVDVCGVSRWGILYGEGVWERVW